MCWYVDDRCRRHSPDHSGWPFIARRDTAAAGHSKAIHDETGTPFMPLLGTLLVAAGAYLGVGLLVWLAPDLEPDGTARPGLKRNR